MFLSFAHHLAVVSHRMSPGLFSGPASWALESFTGCFPYGVSADFGFESRLEDPEPSCDFFLQFTREGQGARMIAGTAEKAGLSAALSELPVWKGLASLFAGWGERGSFLNETISQFWFEFDYSVGAYNPVPNVFFRVEEGAGSRQEQCGTMLAVLDEVYRILSGTGFPAPLAHSITASVEALPEGAGVYQTGFMIPRKDEAVRLILTKMTPDAMLAYLGRIGWSGDTAAVSGILERYACLFDYVVFNLHTGTSVLPYLGMELYFRGMKQPQWEPRWKEVLDRLEVDGMLLPAKRAGLLAFCSRTKSSFPFGHTYINGINHLKFVCKKGLPTECKAYFGTMIRQDAPHSQQDPHH